MPNVEYEVTKGVGKVVQELHEMFELVFFFIMMATIYIFILLGNWGGGGCHWDGGEQVGWQGRTQGGKGGHQGVEEG